VCVCVCGLQRKKTGVLLNYKIVTYESSNMGSRLETCCIQMSRIGRSYRDPGVENLMQRICSAVDGWFGRRKGEIWRLKLFVERMQGAVGTRSACRSGGAWHI
jgi:hypothetical protein